MYSYYFITALKPEYKKKIWWKKYITQMQMVILKEFNPQTCYEIIQKGALTRAT